LWFPAFAGMTKKTTSASQQSVDLAGEPAHPPRSGISDEPHLTRLPRLEARRGTGRDVEAEAARLLAVELQCCIRLVEMVVRADLDRPVAGIGDGQSYGRSAGIHLDVAGGRNDFA